LTRAPISRSARGPLGTLGPTRPWILAEADL
jgi:hypothetical protein